MTHDQAVDFTKDFVKKAEKIRAALLIEMDTEGHIDILSHGPTGSLNEFIFMEKVLSNFLADVMTGRVKYGGWPPNPEVKKGPHLIKD